MGFKHHGALYELFLAIPKPNPPLRSKQEVKYLEINIRRQISEIKHIFACLFQTHLEQICLSPMRDYQSFSNLVTRNYCRECSCFMSFSGCLASNSKLCPRAHVFNCGSPWPLETQDGTGVGGERSGRSMQKEN